MSSYPDGGCETCNKPYPNEDDREMPAGDPRAKGFCWANPDWGDECDGNGEPKDAARSGAKP